MNCSVYLLGDFGYGYQQYPYDQTKRFLKNKPRGDTGELHILRNGDLIYYAYYRPLTKNTFFGICISLNGQYLTQPQEVVNFFNNETNQLAASGKLIRYSTAGAIESVTEKLTNDTAKCNVILEDIRNHFSSQKLSTNNLPAVNYSITSSSIEFLSFETSSADEITNASINNSHCLISSLAIDTSTYQKILQNLNEQNSALSKQNKELQDENSKLKRIQKQYNVVIILITAIIILGIIAYFWISSLNGDVSYRDNVIDKKSDTIRTKNGLIKQKNDTISLLNDAINEKEDVINSLNDTIYKKIEIIGDKDKRITALEEGELYEIYAQSNPYAFIYTKDTYGYFNKSNTSISDYTRIRVFHYENSYALSNYGYFRIRDIRRVNADDER